MTAAAISHLRKAATVKTVSMIFAKTAAATARYAEQRCVLAVCLSVRDVKSMYAAIVWELVTSVEAGSVKIV